MTTLTTRIEIFETKKIITSELTKIQKACLDDDFLQYYKEENEEHLYWEQFDCLDREIIECDTHYKIISLDHSDISSFTKKLSDKLIELFQAINIEELIIISHLKKDFFGNRENKHKPLVNSYKKLEKIVGQKTYKEAFTFDLDSLPDFMEILFWITRCDMHVAEYIFLYDKDEQIQINLCKYGNIHLLDYKNEKLTNEKLISLGWTIIDDREYDNFTDDGKIKGRQIKV